MNYFLNIDILKTIGILFLIMTNILGANCGFSFYIYAFLIPLFFFISGYLFHDYEPKIFFTKKIKRLILPYFGYGLLNFLLCIALFKNFIPANFIKPFFTFNNNPGIIIAGDLWFLTALFFANTIFYLLHRYLKEYLGTFILLFAIFVLFFQIKLPYSIDTAICMLPVFYIGYKFKDIRLQLSELNEFLIAVIILIFSFFTIYLNGKGIWNINVKSNDYLNPGLFYFNCISAITGFYYISKILENFKNPRLLGWIGKNSLEFLCLHQVILTFFKDNLKIMSELILFILTFGVLVVMILFKNAILHTFRKN